MSWFDLALLIGLFGIIRELRLIRSRLGGTLNFWPWKED